MSGIRAIRKLKSWLESKDEDVLIGWYSEKQRNCLWNLNNKDGKPCAHVYLTPEGEEVIVTEVTSSTLISSKWDDIKMVGPVTKWVRNIHNMHFTKF